MRGFILLTMFLNSVCAFAQAEFSFDKKTIKFPKAKEGETVNHTYHFTNKGNEPLILTNYEVACKCTKAVFDKTPVMPGDKGSIEVIFDTTDKIAWQDRTIMIYSNAIVSPFKLRFKIMVDNK